MEKSMPFRGTFRITKLYGTAPPAGFSYSAGKHAGLDLVGVDSKDVCGIAPGRIYRSGYDENGWGYYLVIKQEDGLFAIYAHLSKRYKTSGSVQAGEVIGVEGATGKVTGRHLHLELRRAYTDKYSTINPTSYLGLRNQVGVAKVVTDEVKKNIKIILNGKEKTVSAIESEGHNYVKLQDLRDGKIEIGYEDGKPIVNAICGAD